MKKKTEALKKRKRKRKKQNLGLRGIGEEGEKDEEEVRDREKCVGIVKRRTPWIWFLLCFYRIIFIKKKKQSIPKEREEEVAKEDLDPKKHLYLFSFIIIFQIFNFYSIYFFHYLFVCEQNRIIN